MSRPQIEIIQRGQVVQSLSMTVDRLVVGSGEAAHVRLRAASVAPEHLVFEIVDGRHLEAVNAADDARLLLDDLPMTRARLTHGQTVTLGPLAFRVLLPGAAAPPPPASSPAPPAASSPASPRVPSVLDLPTIAPEYRRAKRRRVVLTALAVLLLVGAVCGWTAYREVQLRRQADEYLARQTARDAVAEAPAEYTWSGLVGEGVTIGRDDPAPRHRTTSSDRAGSGGGGGSSASVGFSVTGAASTAPAADGAADGALGALDSEGRDDRVLEELARMDADLWEEQYGSGSGRAYVDMDQVEAVLQTVSGSARMCYKDAVEDRPDLRGVMAFSLTLSTSGRITSVGLDGSSTLTDPALKSCIEKYIRAKTYPRARNGPVTFTYPMRFQ